jgi:hypothetical protein
MALFGERRGLTIGRSWATRIFAIAFAFFSVVTMAACEPPQFLSHPCSQQLLVLTQVNAAACEVLHG